MPKSYVGEYKVTTVDSSITTPALILTQDRNPEIVSIDGALFADDAKRVTRQWPGDLKMASFSLLSAAGGVRIGRRMNIGIIAGESSVSYCPLRDSIQGLLRRAVSWSGNVPIMYGVAACFNQVLTDTDKIQYTLIYEDEDE